jgi:Leucine-rich repeat (LRR) protein
MKKISLIIIFIGLVTSFLGQKKLGDYSDLKEAMKSPDSVISLTLRERGYRKIPKEVYNFKNLQYLDLSMNKIKKIPKNLSTLDALKTFVISHSPLCNIDNMVECKTLEDVTLIFNRINKIPENIGNLTSLKKLNLVGNCIENAPQSICNLSNLEYLGIYEREYNCMISVEQQEQYKSCLPNCKFKFSEDVRPKK